MDAILRELAQPIPGMALVVFTGLMITAAVGDLLTYTITNKLNLTIGLAFLVFAILLPVAPFEIATRAIWATVVFFICAQMFHFGWMGGGDVKMIPMVMLWIPHNFYLELLTVIALYGGVLTLTIMLMRAIPMPVFTVGWTWLDRIHAQEKKIPYGIAIALGAMTLKLMEVSGNLLT